MKRDALNRERKKKNKKKKDHFVHEKGKIAERPVLSDENYIKISPAEIAKKIKKEKEERTKKKIEKQKERKKEKEEMKKKVEKQKREKKKTDEEIG